MIKKVLDAIKKYNLIQSGESVVVGVSGGPDSVCLLHVLYLLAEELNIRKLYAVHVNHMLRGDEARLDEAYVTSLCDKLGIQLFTKACDINMISEERGMSLEEAGREVRYEQFELILKKVKANRIAVAHNKNDQAETILLNILRGTGLEGLRGMDYSRDTIIRPLLGIDRREIEMYCAEKGLNPRTDSSNLKNVYTRNKVRLDLIPYIDRLFQTNITDRLVKTSFILRDDNDYIEQNVVNIYDQCVVKRDRQGVQLELPKISELHRAMQKRIIRNAIKEVKGNLKGIENIHIEDTLNIIQVGRTGSELQLPSDLRIKRSYGTLKIWILDEVHEDLRISEKKVNIPGETMIAGFGTTLEASIEAVLKNNNYYRAGQDSFIQFFDYDKLKEEVKIRNRIDGDLFKPYRSNGTKKLKEYFIDNKIPKEDRDKIPVVAKGNEIVWIIGYKISDKFKVTENTKSILKLEFKNK